MSNSSWELKSLDEIGSISRGKSKHRPRDASHLFGGPYPFIQTGDVKSAGLILESYSETYSEEGLAQSKLWPKGTLCITIAANIAETSILGIDACFPDSVIGFIPHKGECDVRFIKYVLELKKMEIQSAFAGSTQLNMSMQELLKWKFPIPPYDIQKKIGDHVSDYDYMVRSNRNVSDLSQQLMSNLFRSWFIDFEPVKAKAEGKVPYGMDKETAALFPDSFEDSELGLIPFGWREISFRQILSERREKDGGRNAREFSCTDKGVFPRENKFTKTLSADSSKNKIAKQGDIVFGMSRKILNFGLMREKIGGVSSAYSVYEITSESIKPDFVERFMKARHDYYYNLILGSGREGQSIDKKYLPRMKFIIPDQKIVNKFYQTIAPMENLVSKLTQSNSSLDLVKNSVLPRAMLGELSI